MSSDLLVVVVGALATGLALAFGIPQWLRIRRTGSLAGVSLPSITNTLISTTAWLLYGLQLRDVWVFAMSLAGLPVLVATFVVVLRNGGGRTGMWVPVSWASLLTAAALAAPWVPAAFPAILGGSILWYVTPAAITAWRSPDISGIASGTWLLLVIDGVIAGAYGVLAEVPASVTYAILAILGALIVLARVWWRWSPECGECAPVARCTCYA